MLKYAGCDCPHDHAEDKPSDGKERIVDADLFGSCMASTAVRPEDTNADEKRYGGNGEDQNLGPDFGGRRPCGLSVSSRE